MNGRWISAATIVVVAISLVGCSDKKKSESADTQAPPPVIQGLAAVPANATTVIGIDVAALAGSQVAERALQRLYAREPGLQAPLAEVFQACEIRPKRDLASVTIAILPSAAKVDSLLVAKGKFEQGKLVSCLGKSLGKLGGHLETSEFEGRPIYHEVRSGPGVSRPGVWLAFGSSDTVLLSSGRGALEEALGGGAKLSNTTSGEGQHLGQYLSRAQTDANLWVLHSIDPLVGEGLIAATGGHIQAPIGVIASANLSGGLTLNVELEMRSEADAKMLISQAMSQLEAVALVLQIDSLGRMVQKAELAAEGHLATLRWSLNEEELRDLIGANLSDLSTSIDKHGANDENPAKSESETPKRKLRNGNEERN